MSKILTAFLSITTICAAFSTNTGSARAADKGNNVTEDQIIRALAPEKKPLTRGLSAGPQADPAAAAAAGKLVQQVRGRTTRSLSVSEREEIAAVVKDKPK